MFSKHSPLHCTKPGRADVISQRAAPSNAYTPPESYLPVCTTPHRGFKQARGLSFRQSASHSLMAKPSKPVDNPLSAPNLPQKVLNSTSLLTSARPRPSKGLTGNKCPLNALTAVRCGLQATSKRLTKKEQPNRTVGGRAPGAGHLTRREGWTKGSRRELAPTRGHAATSSAATQLSGARLRPQNQDKGFLLYKPLSSWCFAVAAGGNEYSI